jgi:hypothetical protein
LSGEPLDKIGGILSTDVATGERKEEKKEEPKK